MKTALTHYQLLTERTELSLQREPSPAASSFFFKKHILVLTCSDKARGVEVLFGKNVPVHPDSMIHTADSNDFRPYTVHFLPITWLNIYSWNTNNPDLFHKAFDTLPASNPNVISWILSVRSSPRQTLHQSTTPQKPQYKL